MTDDAEALKSGGALAGRHCCGAQLVATGRVRNADSPRGPSLERSGIPGNPLGRETAGRDRITITAARGDPVPIPPELLGVVARCREGTVASRFGLLFQLLTGCRGVEIHGHKLHKYQRARRSFAQGGRPGLTSW